MAGISLGILAAATVAKMGYDAYQADRAHDAAESEKGKLAAEAQRLKDEAATRSANEAADAANARKRDADLLRARAARAGMGGYNGTQFTAPTLGTPTIPAAAMAGGKTLLGS